jgi:Fic family protein
VRKEAVLSSQIEGTQATLVDLFRHEAEKTSKEKTSPDVVEVCNYLNALSVFLKRHRAEYYRLLNEIRAVGDFEAWDKFFLEGIAVTAPEAVATTRAFAFSRCCRKNP